MKRGFPALVFILAVSLAAMSSLCLPVLDNQVDEENVLVDEGKAQLNSQACLALQPPELRVSVTVPNEKAKG
jgi:hypothetical protein